MLLFRIVIINPNVQMGKLKLREGPMPCSVPRVRQKRPVSKTSHLQFPVQVSWKNGKDPETYTLRPGKFK